MNRKNSFYLTLYLAAILLAGGFFSQLTIDRYKGPEYAVALFEEFFNGHIEPYNADIEIVIDDSETVKNHYENDFKLTFRRFYDLKMGAYTIAKSSKRGGRLYYNDSVFISGTIKIISPTGETLRSVEIPLNYNIKRFDTQLAPLLSLRPDDLGGTNKIGKIIIENLQVTSGDPNASNYVQSQFTDWESFGLRFYFKKDPVWWRD